jgi:hypothetical protein
MGWPKTDFGCEDAVGTPNAEVLVPGWLAANAANPVGFGSFV